MRDIDRIFHETWLGLAQPIEGLVFSLPALVDAQIVPAERATVTTELRGHLVPIDDGKRLALRDVRHFFESFLGYHGALFPRAALPGFYAPEAGQQVRASFALSSAPPTVSDDPFAEFETISAINHTAEQRPLALVWDLGDDTAHPTDLDLDVAEDATGPWRYPPTAKLERLLRHTEIPIGFVSNRRELRLVYAPPGETTSHLTFRFDDLAAAAGRPLALALEALFHARRTYSADPRFTFAGLLAESRRRQADVTERLAEQVQAAVETLLAGFAAAAQREATERPDWLRAAMESGEVYQGVLTTILRLVFVLYAEDRSLLPVDNSLYATQLSLLALYERLLADAGAHPESMHGRFGAYGACIALFRAIYFGVRHGSLVLPARQGKLFDPNAYPFLEGGLPGWTAAVNQPLDRAGVVLPSIDDGTVLAVLHGLVVLGGQRLSYRDLSIEQLGAVYESLMGYEVVRAQGPAVRLGKAGIWIELEELRASTPVARGRLLDDRCDLSSAAQRDVLAALEQHADDERAADAIAIATHKRERASHRARAGQLVLQPTASRRSTGSHYTPRSLTERVVRRTLEPVLACLGANPTAEQILSLKICDPAMGSGAFLVAACRHLGDQVVEAWRRSGELPKQIEAHGDPLRFAKRLVAERCLYGVDKNATAVELAKLSLWLETMSADRSFTFLDHVLCHGDSLVGLDLEQIRAFHWEPTKQVPLVRGLVDRAMEEVRAYREQILALADDEGIKAQRNKRRLLDLAEMAQRRVALVADACVGAFFAATTNKAREAERLRRLDLVEAWLAGDESRRPEIEELTKEHTHTHTHTLHIPFHWAVRFPEIFYLQRPDPLAHGEVNRVAFVDAIVGNPPFMGKNGIAAIGAGYLDWLLALHPGAHGNADLSAHFFRRGATLLGAHGAMGLIATNTIAQGDTRSTGLQHLVEEDGFVIYDAIRSMPWPGDAAVTVSVVTMAKGLVRAEARVCRLDDVEVETVSTQLRSAVDRRDPAKLAAMAGASFQGSVVLGLGFTLTPEERDALVAKSACNVERIFPYLGGQEVNTSPTQMHDRYVISFGQMSLEEAERWPDLLRIVREKVKPDRDQNKRDNYRLQWWRFGEGRPGLYAAIAGLERCLVNSRVSKHLMFSLQPTNRVYSEQLYVYPLPAYSSFAVLQSRIHEPWARLLSSSMKNDLRYAASDCFETFPFPQPDPRTVLPALEALAERLYTTRAQYMVDADQGLTKTYNQLKDPACTEPRILALRELHEAVDRAVLAAYGWSDLTVPPFCPKTPAEEAALEQFKEAVIDRLFTLNAARAAEEARLGLAKPSKAKSVKPKPAKTEPLVTANAPTTPKSTKPRQKRLFAPDTER